MTQACYSLIVTFFVGFALGSFFFIGLWWTVNGLMMRKYAWAWLLASLIVRFGVVLGCFYWLAPLGLASLLLALGGFLLARIVITSASRRLRADARTTKSVGGEVSHAN